MFRIGSVHDSILIDAPVKRVYEYHGRARTTTQR